jgi:hypothetical protein
MDPKVLVVLGMGGLMFFLFLIVGIVVWINSEEEDELYLLYLLYLLYYIILYYNKDHV